MSVCRMQALQALALPWLLYRFELGLADGRVNQDLPDSRLAEHCPPASEVLSHAFSPLPLQPQMPKRVVVAKYDADAT